MSRILEDDKENEILEFDDRAVYAASRNGRMRKTVDQGHARAI